MPPVLTTDAILVLTAIFLLGGVVKGTVGFGLPTIGIGLGAMVVDIPTAMLLIAVPTVVTNLWQIVVNGDPWAIGRRLWVFLLSSVSLIPVGIAVLIYVPNLPYEQLLGLVIVLYSVWTLVGKDLVLSEPNSKRYAIGSGAVNALITGLTGCFSVPGVMYLRALGLSKTDLLCAMGLLYLLSAIGMSGSLWALGHATRSVSLWSLAACVPVIVGVALGTFIQRRLSEGLFRKIFLLAFTLIGVALMVVG